jgi:hypothetical protein
MMPCKFTSPTFAVTAAILGGIALAVSTCEAAVITLFPTNTSTLRSECDPVQRWIVAGIHQELFQDYDRERTIVRSEFLVPALDLATLTSAVLSIDIVNLPDPVPNRFLSNQISPRLSLTTVPEPGIPFLSTFALFLFATRHRRHPPSRSSITNPY